MHAEGSSAFKKKFEAKKERRGLGGEGGGGRIAVLREEKTVRILCSGGEKGLFASRRKKGPREKGVTSQGLRRGGQSSLGTSKGK